MNIYMDGLLTTLGTLITWPILIHKTCHYCGELMTVPTKNCVEVIGTSHGIKRDELKEFDSERKDSRVYYHSLCRNRFREINHDVPNGMRRYDCRIIERINEKLILVRVNDAYDIELGASNSFMGIRKSNCLYYKHRIFIDVPEEIYSLMP